MSEVVKFRMNLEQELHLAFGTGKQCSGIKGPQFLYTLLDGRIAFADPPLDAKIQQLGPKSGAKVTVTKRPEDQWEVKMNPPAEQPRQAASPEARPAAQRTDSPDTHGNPTMPNGHANGNGHHVHHVPDAPYSHTGWAAHLRDQATSLIDVAASCHRYAAEKYPGMLRPEDVSDLLTTVYIGMQKR
jgi:hypothetical protein